MSRSAFTLIELLVVIAILAVLAVVVVLTLNPAGLLQESRDNNRLSDMATLNSAINIFSADVSSANALGQSNVIYISVPDPSATSTAGDQCQGLGMPVLPTGWIYRCASPTYYRLTNGTGWLPINFSAATFGTPLAQLAVDPTNTTSSNLYYEYMTNGTKYEITAGMESQKYLKNQTTNDGGIDPARYEAGSTLVLLPQAEGLVGYWPLSEGSGGFALDQSGNGNNGIWNGTAAGTSGYYSLGKVGNWAGYFNGGNDYIGISNAASGTNLTYAVWFNQSSSSQKMLFSLVGTAIRVASSAFNWYPDVTQAPVPIAATINLSQWYQFVITQTSTNYIAYLNGIQIASGTTFAININTYSNQIGAYEGGGVWPNFSGLIDDVRAYNRILSPSEVQALYNAEH